MDHNSGLKDLSHEAIIALLKENVNQDDYTGLTMSCIKYLDAFYLPDIPLDNKLEDLGYTKLQIASLIKRYSMSLTNEELETIPVIEPSAYENVELPKTQWAVTNMIPEGVSILAAPPKYHKSFFALQLGVSVCSGTSFLGYETVPGDCIYFDLESNKRRPLNRLKDMYNTLEIKGLHIITAQSGTRRLDEGFEEDLDNLLLRYPNTRLVIIDVLQYITPAKAKDNVYSSDYDTINRLNAIASYYRISILVVHHTRKMRDEEDPINNITGSTGLTGAVSTILQITQDRRVDKSATLFVTGNDIESRELIIHFDENELKWHCDGDAATIAQKAFAGRPEVQTISHLMKSTDIWTGSASELSSVAAELGYGISPELFGRFLSVSITELHTVGYEITKKRNEEQRLITISRYIS